MFDELPSETLALKILLADLHDGLEGKVGRLRVLIALESDFGKDRGLLLPGGTPAQLAYLEVRQAFVVGNHLSVVLLSQCVLENALGAEIALQSLSREIEGQAALELKSRPAFRDVITACRRVGILDAYDEAELLKLGELRNALAHFRDVSDQSHLDRRSINQHTSAIALCEADARFAITLFVRMLSKAPFRFDTIKTLDNC